MKNVKIIFTLLLIAGGSLFYYSCQKDHMSINPINSQQSGNSSSSLRAESDEAYMNNEVSYIDDVFQTVLLNNSTVRGFGNLPACATVTYDTSGAVKTATIDFGATPCQTNGVKEFKQGILIISWNGNKLDSGTVFTVTTQNYFVGDTSTIMHQLQFTKTITNMGVNAAGDIHFAIVVTDATLTLDSNQVITWSANRDREWVQGDTTTTSDDIYFITGSSSGTDRNGEPFTVQITSPLRSNADCDWIVSGTEVVTHGNNSPRTLDYGNGDCDNIVTVTVNGNTIIMHIGG